MTDREKVIKGLELCSVSGNNRDCDSCPIGFGEGCGLKLKRAALALLKAQEPRVMTLEDLRAIYDTDEKHIWPYDTPPYLYFETRPNQEAPSGWHGWLAWREIKRMLEEGYLHCNRDDCGKTWRCWTSCPDQATMEVTPWN